MLTLLRPIASSPHTPMEVLDHLIAYARIDGPPNRFGEIDKNTSLRRALIVNPKLTVAQVRQLLDLTLSEGRQWVQRDLYTRPDLDADMLLDMLGDNVNASLLADALTHFPDEDGTLAARAAAGPYAHSVMVRSAIVASPTADRALRRATALALAPVAKLATRVVNAIWRLADEDMQAASDAAEFEVVAAWVRRMVAAAGSDVLVTRLAKLPAQFTTPAHGSCAWLSFPTTTTDDVLAWLGSLRGTKAVRGWQIAVTHAPDVDGRLARCGQDAQPGNVEMHARIVRRDLPVPVRQDSARRLLAMHEHHPYVLRGLTSPLMAVADTQYITDHLRHPGADLSDLFPMLRRTDLGADLIDEIVAARLRLLPGRQNPAPAFDNFNFGMWLATHPGASTEQRRHAVTIAHPHDPMMDELAPATTFTPLSPRLAAMRDRLVEHVVDAWEQGGPAAAGGVLPLRMLNDEAASGVGVQLALSAALQVQLPATFDNTAVMILSAIAGDFDGTLQELMATVRGIAA